MIVTSLMNYLQALPCGILPALPPNFPVAFQQDSARIVLNFPRDIAHSFPVTFIWNGDLPSQGIVRQVGCPNGSISLPSAQPTCPTDMRGWWVGVQMIVTSLMNYLQALPCGILPALPPNFHVAFQWESARIASGISLQYPSDNIHNLPRGIQWHCPTIST